MSTPEQPRRKSGRGTATEAKPGQKKEIKLICGDVFYNRLLGISRNTRSGRPRALTDTVRMLINIGLQQWEIENLLGIRTGKQRKEYNDERKAKAEAVAARREAEKQRKEAAAKARKEKTQGQSKDASKAQQSGAGVPLLVPLEFEDDWED